MKNSNQSYDSFSQDNDFFTANSTHFGATKLPAGAYALQYDPNRGKLFFLKFEIASDQLLDLPTKAFHDVVSQIEVFLRPETKGKFEKYGYLYKRSALLYGSWGTGKTCIVARIADYAMQKGSVVLFNPDPALLETALNQLQSVQPETTVVVIFEELDKLMQRHEGALLSILDGEVQKSNVIYLATTNFIDRIPPRVKRPGRFSQIVEVGFPDATCREFYLKHKLGADDTEIPGWISATEGLSIDELKETVLAVKCLGQSLPDVVGRIMSAKITPPLEAEDIENDSDEGMTIDLPLLRKINSSLKASGVSRN